MNRREFPRRLTYNSHSLSVSQDGTLLFLRNRSFQDGLEQLGRSGPPKPSFEGSGRFEDAPGPWEPSRTKPRWTAFSTRSSSTKMYGEYAGKCRRILEEIRDYALGKVKSGLCRLPGKTDVDIVARRIHCAALCCMIPRMAYDGLESTREAPDGRETKGQAPREASSFVLSAIQGREGKGHPH